MCRSVCKAWKFYSVKYFDSQITQIYFYPKFIDAELCKICLLTFDGYVGCVTILRLFFVSCGFMRVSASLRTICPIWERCQWWKSELWWRARYGFISFSFCFSFDHVWNCNKKKTRSFFWFIAFNKSGKYVREHVTLTHRPLF